MATTLDVETMNPNKFTPIAKRHFLMAIEGVDSFLVKSVSRPQVTTEEVKIPWINQERKIAGRTTFGTMTVKLHSAIAPSAEQQIMEWSRLCHEAISGRDGYPDFYKRDIQLKVLDPMGTIIQMWEYKGAFITEANFGDMAYEGSDLAEIDITLAYDVAILLY